MRRRATDLLLVPGAGPVLRIDGSLEKAGGDEALSARGAFDLLSPSLSAERHRRYLETGAVDLSLRVAGLGRFRVNLHHTRRGAAAALRVLPKRIPPLSELGLPEMLYDLTKSTRGLVLVTGPTGSGKTTTLAALVDRMNRTEKRHIVTIEDPVEYEHAHAQSLVEQVEVGVDAPSFAAALVSALRQDPDVILVGEMRDLETTRTAVTAAETGHLVLTTLHTNDVPQTINRILDIFPPEQQVQVRQQLSLALAAIVCQQLVPKKNGSGRALAVEIAVATDSLRAHIRRGLVPSAPPGDDARKAVRNGDDGGVARRPRPGRRHLRDRGPAARVAPGAAHPGALPPRRRGVTPAGPHHRDCPFMA